MRIGQLADRADVTVDTIRYYEKRDLLPDPRQGASGFRDYDQDAVARLSFIRRAQALGFTLREISALLDAREDEDVAAVRAQAQERLQQLEADLRELLDARNALAALIHECPGEGLPADCPILMELDGNTSAEL